MNLSFSNTSSLIILILSFILTIATLSILPETVNEQILSILAELLNEFVKKLNGQCFTETNY